YFFVFLITHFLNKNIHDNQRGNGEQKFVLLDGINFKNDEGFIKKRAVKIIVEYFFVVAPFVKLFKDKTIFLYVELNFDRFHERSYCLCAVLIKGVEVQFRYLLLLTKIIGIIIGHTFRQNRILHLRELAIDTFPYQSNQAFDNLPLFFVILYQFNFKRIHGNGLVLLIGNVLASKVTA